MLTFGAPGMITDLDDFKALDPFFRIVAVFDALGWPSR
jgi:hypothetical protein